MPLSSNANWNRCPMQPQHRLSSSVSKRVLLGSFSQFLGCACKAIVPQFRLRVLQIKLLGFTSSATNCMAPDARWHAKISGLTLTQSMESSSAALMMIKPSCCWVGLVQDGPVHRAQHHGGPRSREVAVRLQDHDSGIHFGRGWPSDRSRSSREDWSGIVGFGAFSVVQRFRGYVMVLNLKTDPVLSNDRRRNNAIEFLA